MFSGFWHIPIAPRDKEKNAVITHVGLFQFKRLPFGLRNAPASFQRLVNTVFSDLLFPRDEVAYLSAYVDDLLCHSFDWDSHLRHIENVFVRCEKFGLSLKPSKCEFAKHEQEFLGHTINSTGRRPDEAKMQAVSQFPVPKNSHDVQKFLGLAGYYRDHIQSFASRSFHLRLLIRKNMVFSWGKKEQSEFEDLKQALCSDAVMLHHPDWSKPFLIQTDASAKGLGAVLAQIDPNGKERPVRYASRTLLPLESKWTTREQELIAVIWACETFHRYIWGQHFTIQTDHANLKWLQSVSPQKGRLARWAMRLAEYEFDLQHKPGRANVNADAFSRYPIDANLYYTDRYYSDVVLEPFTDLRTCITLYSLLGFDSHDHLFHNPSVGYLPFDFASDCLVTLPDTQNYTDNATDDDTQLDFIALQPSLIEFRAQQRACTELGEIIDFLERTSLDKLGQKIASKKLRSLEIKCKNYSIDPIDVCLKYFDPFAEDGTNYLFVVPVSLRRQFLYAHHNAPLSGGHRGRDSTLGFLRQKYY